MSIITYPLNGIQYSASDVETYLSTRTSGVFSADDNFDINLISDGRTVVIGAGIAWINDGKFKGKSIVNTENVSITIKKPTAAQSVMHRVILRFNDAENKSDIILVSGIAGTNVPPRPVRDGGIYDLVLYTIRDNPRKYMLQQSDIIDERLNESVCGIVRDGVERIPTDVLMARANALLDELEGKIDNSGGEGGGGNYEVIGITGEIAIDDLPIGLSYAAEDAILKYLANGEDEIYENLSVESGSCIIKTVGKVKHESTDEMIDGAITVYVIPQSHELIDEYNNKSTFILYKIIPFYNQYEMQYRLKKIENKIEVVGSIPNDLDYGDVHPNRVPSVGAVIDYVSKNGGGSGDCVSPTINVSEIDGGHRITITDANGTRNVDVMDGEDGYTPQKGVDYFDGEDGYTPVKGVDYFDGEDGNDGTSVTVESVSESPEDGGDNVVTFSDGNTLTVKNGKKGGDGVSPTVTVSKSGKVTTVKITDKEGTKTATINDGEDGDPYTLTDADKQTIVDEVVETMGSVNAIPSYYADHIAEKIATIKDLQGEGGKDCFSFVFLTDIHYPSNIGKNSPILAKEIIDKCNIRFVLNGGDNNTRGCYQTKEEILAENKQINTMFAPIKNRLLQVEGNHDGSYYWSGGTVGSGTSYAKQLTEQEMFEEYYRANGLNADVHFDENSNAFYVDDVTNKVRYIGLNSMNVPNETTDVTSDGTAKYCKFRSYQFLQAQYDFLCDEALATVPSDLWSVVVFGHSGIYNDGDYAVMVDVLSAYKDKTNCVAEYAGTAGGGVAYTNLAEPLPNNTTDSTKWVNGYRISSTAITTSSGAGKTICNPIPIKTGDIIRVKGVSFADDVDRALLAISDAFGHAQYVSSLPDSQIGYVLNGDVHEFTILSTYTAYTHFRCAFSTPTNPEDVIITVNQPIVEAEHGYDYVSVNHDFTDAKGEFIAYFHGHDHQDAVYTRDSIVDISTRCDSQQENDDTLNAERVAGTITEQSFDVFTVNKKTGKIYATKIGAGSDREITY